MKNPFTIKSNVFLFLVCIFFACKIHAQNNLEPVKNEVISRSLNSALSKFLSQGNNPIRSDLALDLSKDFALSVKLNLSPNPNNKKKKNSPAKLNYDADTKDLRPWSFVLNAKFSSTNNYTPILSKGKWAISTDLGITFNYFFGAKGDYSPQVVSQVNQKIVVENTQNGTSNSTYDIVNSTPINTRINIMKSNNVNMDLFRIFWFSLDAKYNFKEYIILKDSIYPTLDELTNSTLKSGFQGTLQFNGLRIFNIKNGVQLSGSIGASLDLNNSNYEKLKEVKVSQASVITDSLGNSIKISPDETTVRKGNLVFSPVSGSLFGDIHLTFVKVNSDKLSIDIFAKPVLTINKDYKILNLLSGVNFAVSNKTINSVVNVGIAVNFKNLTQKFNDADDYKSRIIPTLILGVPLPSIGGPK